MTKQKKTVEIIGFPVLPIQAGASAFIQENHALRRTTTVLWVNQRSQTEVWFETQNTYYVLHIAPQDHTEAAQGVAV